MVKSVQPQTAGFYDAGKHPSDEAGPSDFRTAVKTKEFPYISGDEKVPDFKQYTKLTQVDGDNIQITYKNKDGKETKRLVVPGDHQYPQVLIDLRVHQGKEQIESTDAGKGKDYQVIEKLDEIPSIDGSVVYTPIDKRLRSEFLFIDYNDPTTGDRKHGIAVKGRDEDIFSKVDTVREKQEDKFESIDEEKKAFKASSGYELVQSRDEIPDYHQIEDIRYFRNSDDTTNKDVLLIDYKTVEGGKEKSRKIVVGKTAGRAAFDKVMDMKGSKNAESRFLDRRNSIYTKDHVSYTHVAKPDNFKVYNEKSAKLEKSDEYVIPTDRVNVEQVEGLDDAVFVTQYKDDDHKSVVLKELVYKDVVGEKKFGELEKLVTD